MKPMDHIRICSATGMIHAVVLSAAATGATTFLGSCALPTETVTHRRTEITASGSELPEPFLRCKSKILLNFFLLHSLYPLFFPCKARKNFDRIGEFDRFFSRSRYQKTNSPTIHVGTIKGRIAGPGRALLYSAY